MADHNEAMRLADWLKARQSHLGSSRESCWDGEQRCWDNYDQAAALLRKQAAELDTLREEVGKLHEAIDAFCEGNKWAVDAWKNRPDIKPLFDIDTARKATQ